MENSNGGIKKDFRTRYEKRTNMQKPASESEQGINESISDRIENPEFGSKVGSKEYNKIIEYLTDKGKVGQGQQNSGDFRQIIEQIMGAKSREEIEVLFKELGENSFDADMWYDIINVLSLDVVQNSSKGETEKLQLAKDRLDLALETVFSESMVGTQVFDRLRKESIKYGDDVRDKESEAWPIEAQGFLTAFQTANDVIKRISNKEFINSVGRNPSDRLKFMYNRYVFNHGDEEALGGFAQENDLDGEAFVEDDVDSNDDEKSLE